MEEEDVERDANELERRDREVLAVFLWHGDVPKDPVAVAPDTSAVDVGEARVRRGVDVPLD